MESIKLSNISFSYGLVTVFDRLSLEINKGCNTSIIGVSSCGKTTLAKILNGSLKYDGSIIINGVEIVKDNFYLLKRYVSVILDERYSTNNLVIDELFNSLNDLNLSVDEERKRVNDVINFFKLENILESKVSSFTKTFRNYLRIIKTLIRNSEYIVFDDIFVNMSDAYIKKIVKYCKNFNITIINITTDMEYLLDSQYMIILYKKGIAMEGKTLECLKEEQLLKRLGFNLPFLVDLSIQLGYYGLLNEIITNNRKMIKAVWK
mgnify:FL=1